MLNIMLKSAFQKRKGEIHEGKTHEIEEHRALKEADIHVVNPEDILSNPEIIYQTDVFILMKGKVNLHTGNSKKGNYCDESRNKLWFIYYLYLLNIL